VELGPRRKHLEMLDCRLAEHLRVQLELIQVSMGDDTPTKVRAERVDDGKFTKALVAHGCRIYSIGVR
jgi:hypothetical protein